MSEFNTGDLYLVMEHKYSRDILVTHHRYWNRDLLLAAKIEEGLVRPDGPYVVYPITREDFKELGGRE